MQAVVGALASVAGSAMVTAVEMVSEVVDLTGAY